MRSSLRVVVLVLALVLIHSSARAQYVELWRITSTTNIPSQGFDLGDSDGSYPVQQVGSQALPGPSGHSTLSLPRPGFGGTHDTPPGLLFTPSTVYGNTDSDANLEFVSFTKSPGVCLGSPGSVQIWDGATGTPGPAIPVAGTTACAVVRWVLLVDVNASDGLGRAEILVHWGDTSSDPDVYGTICYGYAGVLETPAETPASLGVDLLRQNAPNPFAGATRIQYTLPSAGPVEMRIYDVQGRLLRKMVEGRKPAGSHGVVWDGRDGEGASVPTGTYFYELVTDGATRTRKAIRLE